jgi:hypothetical protein
LTWVELFFPKLATQQTAFLNLMQHIIDDNEEWSIFELSESEESHLEDDAERVIYVNLDFPRKPSEELYQFWDWQPHQNAEPLQNVTNFNETDSKESTISSTTTEREQTRFLLGLPSFQSFFYTVVIFQLIVEF